MKKKPLVLLMLLAGSLGVHGQTIKEWLSLTPIQVEKPALSNVRNVNGNIFTDHMLAHYNAIQNINNIHPASERSEGKLTWNNANMLQDTVINKDTDGKNYLTYSATYITNQNWISGKISFNLFGAAEIYIDGKKAAVSNSMAPCIKTLPIEWLPGKHIIIVKSVNNGEKIVSAHFEADSRFKHEELTFTTSPKRGKTIHDILNGTQVRYIGLSSSGKHALVKVCNTVEGKTTSDIHVYRTDNKKIVYTFYGNSIGKLAWIPNKEAISFIQKEGDNYSLFEYNLETQEQHCLIKEDLAINNYMWSPDLTYLLYNVNEDYTERNWEMHKLAGIEDRQAYYRHRSFLCKYDFATGLHSRLTWGNLSTSLMAISPDSKKIIFSTSRPDYEEYPFMKQDIYLMDIQSQLVDTLWKDRLYDIKCSFSPDGKKLLLQGGPSAFGKLGENIKKGQIANGYDSQLYIYDIDSKNVEAITKNFDPSIDYAKWHKNGKIYMRVTEADFQYLYQYDAGKISRIDCPGDMVQNFCLAENADVMMYAASMSNYPTQIFMLNLGNNQSELWYNPSFKDYEDIEFGELKDWNYNYKKGTVIRGRYYLPADFDPNKKYPLIVYYYGGTTPVGRNFGGRWPFNLFAANGYVVYVLQPSGTIGFGQEFSARHQNNWCKITSDEIISSTRAFIKEHHFIDAEHVGCMGASYGGFTTEYLTTQTDLFACAIAHAGISSITSYWGEGYWGYGYATNATAHSYPWNRRDIYVEQSPLYHADQVKVPILLIHGTADVNVPTGESIQFYTALKLLGKDVNLVFVKGADHLIADYNQRILWNNTILSYLAKYLKEKPAWWEHQYKDINL